MPKHKGDVKDTHYPVMYQKQSVLAMNDRNLGEIDALNLNELAFSTQRMKWQKIYIKNEGITRDVIENNMDKNCHPVMLMKNKHVTPRTP